MGAHQMTSVTFCANCGAGMLHVEAETCSSYCRDKLALRRASMVSSAELLERAERAVPPTDAMFSIARDKLDQPEQYHFCDEWLARGIKFHNLPDDAQLRVINAHLVEHDPAIENYSKWADDEFYLVGTDNQPEQQYDPVPDWFVWAMGGVFVAIGIILIWAFA